MKKTAKEIREEIGVSFPKGFADANYDYETYLHNILKDKDKFIEFLAKKLNQSVEDLEVEFEQIK